MRCQDCNKFVSYGDMETGEVETALDEATGIVSVTGRMVLPCGECGSELKSLDVEHEEDVSDKFTDIEEVIKLNVPRIHHDKLTDDWFEKNVDVEYRMDDPDISGTSRQQTTCKVRRKKVVDGKKVTVMVDQRIKNPRHMKMYYGIEISGTVHRKITYKEFMDNGEISASTGEIEDDQDFDFTVEDQASAFDECN